MRIAIKAVQIAPGGGLTHLNRVIEWFGKIAPEFEFLLIGKQGQENLFIKRPPNFDYRFYSVPGLHLAAQVWWERHALPGILRNDEADLLFEPGNRGTLKAPCPKVSLVHNIAPFDDEFSTHETLYQKLRLRLLKRATLESLRATNGIIFLSEFSKSLIGRFADISRVKTIIIYHGRAENNGAADTGEVLSKYGIERPYILNVSHLWRYKKTLEMVAAYEKALKKKSDLPPLYIAGTNYSSAYFRDICGFIEDGGIGDRVRFLGTVPETDLPALYAGCEAFLFPSALEACPNILIEALSAGCAVASSNRGVMPEIAGGAALYFNPDDINDFSDKIISLMVDENLNRSLRWNAVERAAHFSWEKTARETLDFFHKVLGLQRKAKFTAKLKRELVEV